MAWSEYCYYQSVLLTRIYEKQAILIRHYRPLEQEPGRGALYCLTTNMAVMTVTQQERVRPRPVVYLYYPLTTDQIPFMHSGLDRRGESHAASLQFVLGLAIHVVAEAFAPQCRGSSYHRTKNKEAEGATQPSSQSDSDNVLQIQH